MVRSSIALAVFGASVVAACVLSTDTDGLTGGGGGIDATTGDGAAPPSDADDSPSSSLPDGAASVPCATSTGCEVLMSGQGDVRDIVVYADVLYWIRYANDGNVMKLPVDGGGPPELTINAPPAGFWHDLVTHDFGNGDFLFAVGAEKALAQRFESASGCPTPADVTRLAAMAGALLFATSSGIVAGNCAGSASQLVSDVDVRAMASDGGSTIWWSLGTGDVVTCDATSPASCAGSRVVIATGQGSVTSLAASSTRVFWATEGASAEIRTLAKGATGAPMVLAAGQAFPRTLVSTGSDVYWTNLEGGTVMRTPAAGGAPASVVLSDLGRPWGLFLTDTAVYVTESGAGRILRVRR